MAENPQNPNQPGSKAVNSKIAKDRNARDKNVNANSASAKRARAANRVVAVNQANDKV